MPNLLSDAFVKLIAVIGISFGVVEIVKGILLITNHCKWTAYVATFVIGAVLITLGIITLVMNSNDILRVIYIAVGAIIAISGIFQIVDTVKRLKKYKKRK